MGCPCSKRTNARQAGAGEDAAASAPPARDQSGHPSRGYVWNGPEGRPEEAAPAEPAAAE